MKTSIIGRELIKEFEGFRDKAYLCSAGVPTIGYGTTMYPDGRKVALGDKCTKAEAETYLRHDLIARENMVEKYVTVPLTQNQYDAVVSFAYNIRPLDFITSTFVKLLNAKDYVAAAEQLPRWNKVNKQPILGLTRRRAAERALFLK